MRYYVFTDIHSFFTLFQQTLRGAGYFEDPAEKRILLLGDLFDRGPEAPQLQSWILERLGGEELLLVKGNHEELFVKLVTEDRGAPTRRHLHNGTYDTLEQLTGRTAGFSLSSRLRLAAAGRETLFYTAIIPSMPDYIETEHYIFTHAWIPCRREDGVLSYDPDWRSADAQAWWEARWTNPMDAARTARHPEKTIVCGHYHCSYGHARYEQRGSEWGEDADFSPYRAPGVIALDACTAFSGKMNCLVLDD